MDNATRLGLDVHKETIAVAVMRPDQEIPEEWVIPNTPEALRALVARHHSRSRLIACYEAGPTGYDTHRQLSSLGVTCDAIASCGAQKVGFADGPADPYHLPMLFFLIYEVAQRLLGSFAGRSSVSALEIENAVLRHQLAVLRRRAGRPPLRRLDRVLLTAASRLLPSDRWSAPMVCVVA